jgi:hypothetical protein
MEPDASLKESALPYLWINQKGTEGRGVQEWENIPPYKKVAPSPQIRKAFLANWTASQKSR